MTLVIALLVLFGIKHFVCDFVLQFPWMMSDKGEYAARGGVLHALCHGVFTMLIVLVLYLDTDLAIATALIDAIIHYHMDWLKTLKTKDMDLKDRRYWVWFGADQCVHYLTYVLIIGLLIQ